MFLAQTHAPSITVEEPGQGGEGQEEAVGRLGGAQAELLKPW